MCQPAGSLWIGSKRPVFARKSRICSPLGQPNHVRGLAWDILVLIKARISIKPFLYASIGIAIDLLTRGQQRHRIGTGTAVIFAIHALVIVNMCESEDHTDIPIITYSQSFPCF